VYRHEVDQVAGRVGPPTAPPPPAEPVRQIGDYRLERRIGRGAMGEVWLARHVATRGVAAVKILRDDGVRTRDRLARFFDRERRAVARLDHPHVVQLYEVGPDFIATRFIDGSNLTRRLASPITPQDAVDITLQIAAALAHAHERRVVHRDVKPSNILLDKVGNAYLADFGLAALLDDDDRDDTRAGTPQYMAPEQARGDAPGPLADQYSLGRVLAEMLAGGRVPPAADAAIAALPTTLPPAVGAAIRRAIDPDPGRRWQTIADLAAALAAVDLSALPAAERLLPETRVKAPFAWAAACERVERLTPAIMRADYRLSALVAAGAVSADAAQAFRDKTGYADFGWAVVGRTDRLGAITEPAAYARAGELVVMIHGGMCTRDSWISVASHIARDNAQTVVIVPDVSGYGVSRYARRWPRREHLTPEAIRDGVLAWLELLGVRDLPMVLAAHSLGAVAMLTATDAALGARTSRVAVAPVLPAVDARMRWAMRIVPTLALALSWIPGMKWLIGSLAFRWSRSAKAYDATERRRMFANYLRLPMPVLARSARAFADARPAPVDQLAHCMVVLADGDPVAPYERTMGGLGRIGFPPGNVLRLVSDNHFPHGTAEAHPEWAARAVCELAQIVDQLLAVARDGSVPATQVASTLASTGSGTGTAEVAAGSTDPGDSRRLV
jgi:serine/threonine-protein kinase